MKDLEKLADVDMSASQEAEIPATETFEAERVEEVDMDVLDVEEDLELVDADVEFERHDTSDEVNDLLEEDVVGLE